MSTPNPAMSCRVGSRHVIYTGRMKALIFDFDGLIVDTETTAMQSWRELYAAHGEELPAESWLTLIGTWDAVWDPRAELEHRLGRVLDWELLESARAARELELASAQPMLPGVREWLDEADALGLLLGIASSSSRQWVETHLVRLGILERFSALATRHDVERTKPDPALYSLACEALDVSPSEAVAVEDSLHGVAAAHGAGLRVIAVPGPLTSHLDYDEAELQLPSLEAMSLGEALVSLG
ncbi:MAG: HAD family hydrolase [Coriobacteriia bacterium]